MRPDDIRRTVSDALTNLIRQYVDPQYQYLALVAFNLADDLSPDHRFLREGTKPAEIRDNRLAKVFDGRAGRWVMTTARQRFYPNVAHVLADRLSQEIADQLRASETGNRSATTRAIAHTLLDTAANYSTGDVADEPSIGAPGPYIARPTEEAHIAQLYESGVRQILIWGDAGTGKTTLARSIVAEFSREPNERIVIDAQSPESFDETLLVALHGRVDELAGYHVLRVRQFKQFLATTTTCRAVLIDNVDLDRPDQTHYLDLDALIPDECRPLVLVTSRTDLQGPRNVLGRRGRALCLKNMTNTQANEMVSSRLPRATQEERQLLTRTLDGRALAIEHACMCLKDATDITVEEFCALVQERPAARLARTVRDEQTLTHIYQFMYEHRLSEEAQQLLDLVLACGPRVRSSLLVGLWDNEQPSLLVGLTEHKPAASTVYDLRQLIDHELVSRALVVLEPSPEHGQQGFPFGRYLSMHRLTHSILVELRQTELSAIYDRILPLAASIGRQIDWYPGQILTAPQLFHIDQLTVLLPGMADAARRRNPYGDIAGFAVLIVYGQSQLVVADPQVLAHIREIYDRCETVVGNPEERAPFDASTADDRRYNLELLGNELAHYFARFPWSTFDAETHAWAARIYAAYQSEWTLAILLLGCEWVPLPDEVTADTVRMSTRRALLAYANGKCMIAVRHLAAAAEQFLRLGFPHEALETYHQAFYVLIRQTRAEDTYNNLQSINLRIIDICLRIGNLQYAEQWELGMLGRSERRQQDHGPDLPLTDYLTICRLRVTYMNFKRATNFGWVRAGKTLDYLRELGDQILSSEPETVLHPWITYSRWCLEAAHDPHQALANLKALTVKLKERGWSYGQDKCALAAIKVTILIGECPENMKTDYFMHALRIGAKYAEAHIDHLATEAYVTAVVFAIRFDLGQERIGRWHDATSRRLRMLHREEVISLIEKSREPDANLFWLMGE
jgi:hypothetical protein